jgi:hypothetical protein
MLNEIVLYRPDAIADHIEVRVDEETVWLNRQQISTLFNRDVKTIGKHINTIFAEAELEEKATVANFATVQIEGDRTVERQVAYYNLDVIISVGYRVKSRQGIQFRLWASRVLKEYLLKGYSINNRMNRLEDRFDNLQKKVNEIDLQIHSHLIPNQGVFFDGQVFDAYELASKIIRSAKQRIVLIDNYIDESTLTHLSKKNSGVNTLLLSQNASKPLILDVQKANAQYGGFELKSFSLSHDRFLIIDDTQVYHLGASLKDLGKKWFAFSKLDAQSVDSLMNQILKLNQLPPPSSVSVAQ